MRSVKPKVYPSAFYRLNTLEQARLRLLTNDTRAITSGLLRQMDRAIEQLRRELPQFRHTKATKPPSLESANEG